MWRCKEENFGETDGDQYAPSCLDMLTAMSRLWVPAVLCIVSVSVAAGQQTIQTDPMSYPAFSMRCSTQEKLKNCTPGFPDITVDSIDIEFTESSTRHSLCDAAKLHVLSNTNRMLNYFENECPGELAENKAFRVPVKTYMDAYSGHCQEDVSSLTPKYFRAKIIINCNPARAAPKPTDATPTTAIVTFPQPASLTTAITTKLTTKAAASTPSPTTASPVPSTNAPSPSAPSQSTSVSTKPAKTASADSGDLLGATDPTIAATRYADPPTTSPDSSSSINISIEVVFGMAAVIAVLVLSWIVFGVFQLCRRRGCLTSSTPSKDCEDMHSQAVVHKPQELPHPSTGRWITDVSVPSYDTLDVRYDDHRYEDCRTDKV